MPNCARIISYKDSKKQIFALIFLDTWIWIFCSTTHSRISMSVLHGLLTQLEILPAFFSPSFYSDHSGINPGERLCAALSSGSLSDTVSRGLPQYEEDWEPTAPLCGVSWCQGQNPTPPSGTVSATALPTLKITDKMSVEERMKKNLVCCWTSNFYFLSSHPLKEKLGTSLSPWPPLVLS